MNKIAVSLIVSIALLGCSRPKVESFTFGGEVTTSFSPLTTPDPTSLTDEEKISLLRKEAHEKGITWLDFCNDREDTADDDDLEKDWQFQADGWVTGSTEPGNSFLAEDGVKPWWSAHGATQAETAYLLYLALKEDPNMQPTPKSTTPKKTMSKMKICPPELSGH